MKDLWKSGILILLVVGVLYVLFLRECKHPPSCPPQGQVLVPQSSWDSILALANKPPEVRIDTVWVTKPSVTPDPQPPMPNPIPVGADTTAYRDSLVNKEINVRYDFTVRGTLLSRTWSYKPIQTIVSVDSLIYVPDIVYVDKPVETLKNALYAGVVAGGNQSAFLFGGNLDFVTKKGTLIGYQYQRFGQENFHSIRLGVKIKLKR